MSQNKWAGKPVNRCANAQCPNTAGEGAFTVVTTTTTVVGDHRGITLVMCMPCATALMADLNGED